MKKEKYKIVAIMITLILMIISIGNMIGIEYLNQIGIMISVVTIFELTIAKRCVLY